MYINVRIKSLYFERIKTHTHVKTNTKNPINNILKQAQMKTKNLKTNATKI